jgi:hypothetical protein
VQTAVPSIVQRYAKLRTRVTAPPSPPQETVNKSAPEVQILQSSEALELISEGRGAVGTDAVVAVGAQGRRVAGSGGRLH